MLRKPILLLLTALLLPQILCAQTSSAPPITTKVVSEVMEEIPIVCVLLDAGGTGRINYALSPIPLEIRDAERSCQCNPDISRLMNAAKPIDPEFVRDSACKIVAAFYMKRYNERKIPMGIRENFQVYLLVRLSHETPRRAELLGAVPIPFPYNGIYQCNAQSREHQELFDCNAHLVGHFEHTGFGAHSHQGCQRHVRAAWLAKQQQA
jgi:hypothetical protein